MDTRLLSDRFPKSNKYHPAWLVAGCSGGANPLWLTEWLSESLELGPGMRVLDLGCGRALSSIFLHLEFEVDVWAVDLWFSASENLRRVRDAGFENHVFPIHADARSLPFANDFFDSIISIDSFPYYGTDDLYLSYLSRFVKPGGQIAIAGAGLMHEGPVPERMANWWEPSMYCLHSAAWWRAHWGKTGIANPSRFQGQFGNNFLLITIAQLRNCLSGRSQARANDVLVHLFQSIDLELVDLGEGFFKVRRDYDLPVARVPNVPE